MLAVECSMFLGPIASGNLCGLTIRPVWPARIPCLPQLKEMLAQGGKVRDREPIHFRHFFRNISEVSLRIRNVSANESHLGLDQNPMKYHRFWA